MRKTLRKWLILIALLAYAIIMSAWAASAVRERLCTGIEIDIQPAAPGTPDFLKPDAIKSELGSLTTDWSSKKLYDIDTDSLERKLNLVNNFEHVEVVRTSTGKLLISVMPIVPEARIFTPKETYYINKDGKRMDARPDFYVNLPVVCGDFNDRMPAVNVLPVVRYISNHETIGDLITMIDYKSPTNIMLIPRIRGHVINLGDTSDLDTKFNNLLLMYRKVMPYQGWNTYDTISLKFKGRIVATRADKRIRRHSTVEENETDYEEAALPTAEEALETEAIINGTENTDTP